MSLTPQDRFEVAGEIDFGLSYATEAHQGGRFGRTAERLAATVALVVKRQAHANAPSSVAAQHMATEDGAGKALDG
ncbi:hypothetical protein ACFWWT_20940 [Streptomyces sp. NPDC058676]|uniref:hypothetical protein n=1 Tax=unclassified Streptomyces TaxID=2593676 RepID=UPI003669237A